MEIAPKGRDPVAISRGGEMGGEARDRRMIEQHRGLDLDVEFARKISQNAEQGQRIEANSVEGHLGIDGRGLTPQVFGDPLANPR